MFRKYASGCAVALVSCAAFASGPAATGAPASSDGTKTGDATASVHSLGATAGAIDPYTGDDAGYEKLRQQFNVMSMKAKIAQANYKAERYKSQIEKLGAAAKPAPKAGLQSQQLQKQLAQTRGRMEQLASQVQALKKVKSQPQTPKTAAPTHKTKSAKPKLVAMLNTGQTERRAMFRYKKSTYTLASGGHLGPWRVASIDPTGAVLKHGSHRLHLTLAGNPGHISGAASGVSFGSMPGMPPAHRMANSPSKQSISQRLMQQEQQVQKQSGLSMGG